MKKFSELRKRIAVIFILAVSLTVLTAPAMASGIMPNWKNLYKSKIQQIENEYSKKKRTHDSYYNVYFFSVQDFDFDGIPELYHAQINMYGDEYALKPGSEEIYYIKNNRVQSAKVSATKALGLLPSKNLTGTVYDRRGQYAMYDQTRDSVVFVTKDFQPDASGRSVVTMSELSFDQTTGTLSARELLSGTYNSGSEPLHPDGYWFISNAASYSISANDTFGIWEWTAPYLNTEEEKDAQATDTTVNTKGWKQAYESFIFGKEYAKTSQKYDTKNESGIKFGLHDFDGDGVPELLVKNGEKDEKNMKNYIYIYKNNRVVFLSEAGNYNSDFMYVNGYPGLVWTSGIAGNYSSYYYSLVNKKLISEHVMNETINYVNNQMDYSYEQKTKDYALYEACKKSGTKVIMYDSAKINIKGWNNFINESLKNKPLFADVTASSWFYDAVKFASDRGIMGAVSDDRFEPSSLITRGMFVTMLYRIEGQPSTKKTAFVDVQAGSWYEKPIAWATQKGIATGLSNTVFAPGNNITREQLMVFLYRYADFRHKDVSASDTKIKKFFDNKNVSEYAQKAMNWAIENDLISGTSEYYLDPAGFATRAQAAVILQRFCEKYSV